MEVTLCAGRKRWTTSWSAELSNIMSRTSIGRSTQSRTIEVQTVLRVAEEAGYLAPNSREIDDRYLESALSFIHEPLAKVVRLAGF